MWKPQDTYIHIYCLSSVCNANACIVAKRHVRFTGKLFEQVNRVAPRLPCGTNSVPYKSPISPKREYCMTASRIFALRTVAKPLQLAALLLLTACGNLPYQCSIWRYHRRPPTDTCCLKIGVLVQHLHDALQPNCGPISAISTIISTLRTLANALSNAFITDPSLLPEQQ